jgi:hypothetical protein
MEWDTKDDLVASLSTAATGAVAAVKVSQSPGGHSTISLVQHSQHSAYTAPIMVDDDDNTTIETSHSGEYFDLSNEDDEDKVVNDIVYIPTIYFGEIMVIYYHINMK